MSVFNRTGLAAFTLAALAIAAPVWAQDNKERDRLAALIDQLSPSIVNVRVVLKVEVSRMGQAMPPVEQRSEMTGVVVDASGLIMISNSSINASRLNKLPQLKVQGMKVSFTPIELKVIFDGGEEENPAYLAASDTDLDLAFLQLESIDGLTMVPVSFDGDTRPTIGQRLIQISRLSEGFDYAPHFQTGRVSGRLKKPRKAWLLDGGINGSALPILTRGGEVVGVLTSLESGLDDDGGGMMLQMGGAPNMGQPVLIESKVIRGVLKQAKARAAEVAAERAKASGSKPAAESAKPADDDGKGDEKPAEDKPADGPASTPTGGGK